MANNRFPEQVELIERVKTILNLSDEALAAEVAVRPGTMQKYAAGYQKAGAKVMQLIARLPEAWPAHGLPSPQRLQERAGDAARGGSWAPTATVNEFLHDLRLDPPSTMEQLSVVLREGAMNEVRLLREVVGALFNQLEARRRAPAKKQPGIVFFERRPRLLPALGYVPAGLPQGSIEQQADQFIAMPEGKFPEADYALKVHGDSMVDVDIHHGDWVLMTTRRPPRNGGIVAALCDNETCLKTYVADTGDGPYLRSENKAFPPKIVPKEEMQIQGVMVGKLRLDENGTGADRTWP